MATQTEVDLKPGRFGFATDGVRESSVRTSEYVSSPSPTGGSSIYGWRDSREAKYDKELALGCPDESFATSQLQKKQSEPWCLITNTPYKL